MPAVRTIFFSALTIVVATLSACSGDGNAGIQTPSSSGSAGALSGAGTPSMGGTSSGASGAAGTPSGGLSGGGAGGVGVAGGGAAGVGGAGGAPVGPVLPVLREGRYGLDMGDVTLEVDPMVGGRITTFRLGTENLLTGPDVNPIYWGSTLWTSPESQWSQPPPAPIDSAPYTAQILGEKLILTGQPHAPLGVSVSKTFWADTALGAFKIEYKLNNTKQTPIQMAPWEVTRVLPRGLTFFPTGSKQSLSSGATLPTTNSDGVTWFAYDMTTVTKDSKLYADAAEGWLAHVAQGLVFIKSFPDVAPNQIAPNEGDVELYANVLHTYIELENQAAYGEIAAQASMAWTVTWYLRKLPDGMPAAPNAALAQFVRTTIAQ